MKYTMFTLMISEKNVDGSIRFSTMHDLSPMNISSCKIETVDASDKVEFGHEPEIIPMGIGSCTAEIVGTFVKVDGTSASNIFKMSKIAPEIKNYYETIKIFDKINGTDTEFALKLSSLNGGGTRELEGGIWKIKSIKMPRSIKDLGRYQFTIKLSYFWIDKSEQMLCVPGTGTNVTTDCKFTMNYTGVNNEQNPTTGTCGIFNVKISKSLLVLNNARFDCETKMYKDTIIKIYGGNNSGLVVFYGIVTDVETDPVDKIYTVIAKEICDLLYRGVIGNPIQNMVAGFLPELRVIVPCRQNKDDLTIDQMVNKIGKTYYKPRAGFESWNPFPAICKAGSLGGEPTLPGRDEIKISDQVLSGVSVGTAITNFLYRQCGFNMWYNYDTGKLEYGFLRDGITIDLTKEIIVKNDLIDDNQEDVKPDYVVVWDPPCEICSIAGEYGPDKHGLQYVLEDARDAAAAQALAEKILELCTVVNKSTYSVEFPAGTTRFKEGDYFRGLGDQSLPLNEKMEYRSGDDADPLELPSDSVWHIKEVTITDKSTTVVVGMSFYSVIDIYKSSLNRRRDGIPAPTKEQIYITTPVVVGKGAGGTGEVDHLE